MFGTIDCWANCPTCGRSPSSSLVSVSSRPSITVHAGTGLPSLSVKRISGCLRISQAGGVAVGVDPLQWVLTGGEDHAIVATFPPDVKLPARWKVIGEVLNVSALPQVTVDGAPWTSKGGWDHFGAIEDAE